MYNPLGTTVGNGLEIMEAVRCLSGNGAYDLNEIVCTLGEY